jgi:hypothetical protein
MFFFRTFPAGGSGSLRAAVRQETRAFADRVGSDQERRGEHHRPIRRF